MQAVAFPAGGEAMGFESTFRLELAKVWAESLEPSTKGES
jgi:hypothetical protein